MLEKLPGYRQQLEDLDKRISSPEVMSDMLSAHILPR